MVRHRNVEFIIMVRVEHSTTSTSIAHCPCEGTFDSSIALVDRGEATRPFLNTGAMLLYRLLWSTLLLIVDRPSSRRYSRLRDYIGSTSN